MTIISFLLTVLIRRLITELLLTEHVSSLLELKHYLFGGKQKTTEDFQGFCKNTREGRLRTCRPGLSAHFLPQAGLLRSTCVKFLGNSELSVCFCINVNVETFLHLSLWVNKIDLECINKCWCELPSTMKVLMFSRILFKYASEAGYPEHISRCLLTSLHELRLIPFALCFLWSASHNVKGGDTCPFAISRIWSRYFLYRANATRSVKIYSPGICPSPFSRLSFAHSLSLAPPALPLLHCIPFALSRSVH